MSTATKITHDVLALDGGSRPMPAGFRYVAGIPAREAAEREAQRLQAAGMPCEVVATTVTTTTTKEVVSTFDVLSAAEGS